MAEFRSKSAMLEVHFPRDQFGMQQSAEYARNEQGMIATDAKGVALFDVEPWPKAQFTNGVFVTEDEAYISMLRRHSENEAKGGAGFWELSAEQIAGIDNAFPGARRPEEGMTETDYSLLSKLEKYEAQIFATEEEEARALFAAAIERFRITGVALPEKGKVGLLRARIIEALFRIEEELGDEWRASVPGGEAAGQGSDPGELLPPESGAA